MYRIPTNSTQLTSLAGHIKISQVKVRETRKATSTDLDMALLNRAVFQKRNIPSLDRGRCNQTTEHYSDYFFFFFFLIEITLHSRRQLRSLCFNCFFIFFYFLLLYLPNLFFFFPSLPAEMPAPPAATCNAL